MAATPDPLRPQGLGPRGQALWDALAHSPDLPAGRAVLLAEACRVTDRLEKLDQLLRGDISTWTEVVTTPEGTLSLRIDNVATEARQQAGTLRLMLRQLEDHQASPASGEDDGKKGTRKASVDDLARKRSARRARASGSVDS